MLTKTHTGQKQGAVATEPGARALYLGNQRKKHVSCTDQALVVKNDLGQTLRYPLARISRVVSSTGTDWNGAALALCLKNSISISWLDGRGDILGTCTPHQRNYPPCATAVELLTESADGCQRYQNWLQSRRMWVLVRWGKTSSAPIDPKQWETTKRDWVYAHQLASHLPTALQSHCQAWVNAQLAEQSLPAQLWGPQAQPIALDHDLCELLWAEINLCAGHLADSSNAEKPATALFEHWRAVNGSALHLHLSSLCRTAMKALSQD
jgi:hypothetical protein